MFKNVKCNSANWTLRKDVAVSMIESICEKTKDPVRHPEIRMIKDNNVRSVFFCETGDKTYSEVFIKLYKCSAGDAVKHIFIPSKALSEWKTLREFEKKKLPCPKPLAFSEKKTCGVLTESYLVTEALTGAVPFNEYVKTMSDGFSKKKVLIKLLAIMIGMLHKSNIFYRDLHAGNILIKAGGGGNPELFFIDLHRAAVLPGLMQWMRIRDLAQLCNSLPGSKTDKLSFLNEYCGEYHLSENAFRKLQKKLYNKRSKLDFRRIISRSKRCLKNSSVFEKRSDRDMLYFGRKDFGLDAALDVLSSKTDGDITVKKTLKSVITIRKTKNGQILCVKRFQCNGYKYLAKNLFRKTRAMKSWIAANAFMVRGVETPLPLAIVENKTGMLCAESFFITRWLPEVSELNDYIGSLEQGKNKNAFIKAFALTIRVLHEKKILHADLKSNNILVSDKGANEWNFFFVDLDRVYFNKKLKFIRKANNLAQINASVSSFMTPKDRLKFFRFYAMGTAAFADRKKYYTKIIEISRTKITKPYGITFD